MKKEPFIFKTWIICILFALWFVYGIPLIIGIILLIFKMKYEKKLWFNYQEASADNTRLNEMLTPELQDAVQLQRKVDNLKQNEGELLKQIDSKSKELSRLDSEIKKKKGFLISFDDELLVQEFGLYKPTFEFASSLDYKDRLDAIRQRQKDLIKKGNAVTGNQNWQVNGSASQGKKMVSDTQKLLLRAFNSECDAIVSKVKYTNYDASLKKINALAEAISKLGKIMGIEITKFYLDAKVNELALAFAYQQKKQEEKEAQQAARAEMREAAKLQKEIEAQREKIEKEQTHYQTALEKIHHQLSEHPDDPDLMEKCHDLETHLADIDKAINDIDYRQANQKAGYVYVISNIGAFGENVYKIGMTRRLDPQDRIDELGDASVPFNFDVHAMIFSDNAPALEAALHKAFESKKLNMVNQRREFFNVTLDEIKDVIRKNYDKTVEFIDVPDAEQYRVSMKMREETAS